MRINAIAIALVLGLVTIVAGARWVAKAVLTQIVAFMVVAQ